MILREMWNTIKHTNIHVKVVSEREERDKET